MRPILRWRVGPQYYAYALGLPLLIMLALNLGLSALGASTDWGALPAPDPGISAVLPAHRVRVRRTGGARLAGLRSSSAGAAAFPVGSNFDPRARLGYLDKPWLCSLTNQWRWGGMFGTSASADI
jgi:hypothetical protein